MAEDGRTGANAAAASEAIERWLRDRQTVSDEAMESVLLEVRRMVKRLAETTLIRNDATARAALDEMATSVDMDAMTDALGRLDERVGVLLGGAPKAGGEPGREAGREAAPRPRAGRTFLRL